MKKSIAIFLILVTVLVLYACASAPQSSTNTSRSDLTSDPPLPPESVIWGSWQWEQDEDFVVTYCEDGTWYDGDGSGHKGTYEYDRDSETLRTYDQVNGETDINHVRVSGTALTYFYDSGLELVWIKID